MLAEHHPYATLIIRIARQAVYMASSQLQTIEPAAFELDSTEIRVDDYGITKIAFQKHGSRYSQMTDNHLAEIKAADNRLRSF